ncbi:MAG: class I SAM-dependent methyltransferase [Thermoleophilia bacterium]|nr:class I SAM-dependent methyltransferase [Thermoleophilia bacterium]
MRLDDPALVRTEYADPRRFDVRRAVWAGADGVDPLDVALGALAEVAPRRVLEVGCGDGALAERIEQELGAEVVAIDQSAEMVARARTRGIAAAVGDAQALDAPAGSFDCAVAAWMLYHVPARGRALAELARVLRPEGRLVAVTNSEANLHELWSLCGPAARRIHPFSAENGADQLSSHFPRVERRDVVGTVTFPSFAAAHRYVSASLTRAHLADRLPDFAGPLRATRAVAVFVADR